MRAGRNPQFDLARIVFALLVLLSHAPEITDGNAARELFSRLTGGRMTFGGFAVDGFFLLSGYLITASWLGDPKLFDFLIKRALRILPGYAVAVVLSVAVVGLLVPAVPHFFATLAGPHRVMFLHSVLTLQSPSTPPVLAGVTYPLVNGSLWTIAYEFRCYLLIALLGVCGLLRRRCFMLAFVVLLLPFLADPGLTSGLAWTRLDFLLGTVQQTMHFTAVFLVGAFFCLFPERIRFRPVYALVACAIVLALRWLLSAQIEVAVILCGAYLLFYLGSLRLTGLDWTRRVPDISYGVYLYGWPVEVLLIWYTHWSPWLIFAASVPLCVGLGWLSWHLVERPALRLKPRRNQPLRAV